MLYEICKSLHPFTNLTTFAGKLSGKKEIPRYSSFVRKQSLTDYANAVILYEHFPESPWVSPATVYSFHITTFLQSSVYPWQSPLNATTTTVNNCLFGVLITPKWRSSSGEIIVCFNSLASYCPFVNFGSFHRKENCFHAAHFLLTCKWQPWRRQPIY